MKPDFLACRKTMTRRLCSWVICPTKRRRLGALQNLAGLLCLVCPGALMTVSAPAAQQKLSYVELVQRITDLEYVATLPLPGDQCAQWASYDRKSRYDAAADKYIDWDANGDGNGIIRQEGDKEVMAE